MRDRSSITWDDLEANTLLPLIEYVVDEEMVKAYRNAVRNLGAHYPTIAGRHPTRAFYAAYGDHLRAPNMGYRAWYLNPPRVGTRMTVRSHIVGKFARRDLRFVVVESVCNDQDNRLVEISRLTGLVSAAGGPALAAVARKGGHQ